MSRNINNSIIVRVDHIYPTEDWIEAVQDLHFYVVSEATGEVDTIPGPWSGSVDWLFEKEEDAAWFVLKYNGKVISVNDMHSGLNIHLEGFLG